MKHGIGVTWQAPANPSMAGSDQESFTYPMAGTWPWNIFLHWFSVLLGVYDSQSRITMISDRLKSGVDFALHQITELGRGDPGPVVPPGDARSGNDRTTDNHRLVSMINDSTWMDNKSWERNRPNKDAVQIGSRRFSTPTPVKWGISLLKKLDSSVLVNDNWNHGQR